MKIKKLTNRHYDYVRKDIKGWCGLNPTITQLRQYLKNKKDIIVDIATTPYLKYGVDTVTRENIADVFANKLVGEKWPTNANPKRKSKEFFKRLVKNAEKAGIECGIDETLYT